VKSPEADWGRASGLYVRRLQRISASVAPKILPERHVIGCVVSATVCVIYEKEYKPEEIVAKLRQVDVLVSQGQNRVDAIRQIGVSEVTYYRWRQEFGGQVKRLKDLELENSRLRKAVSLEVVFCCLILDIYPRHLTPPMPPKARPGNRN
jgi:putative transposase